MAYIFGWFAIELAIGLFLLFVVCCLSVFVDFVRFVFWCFKFGVKLTTLLYIPYKLSKRANKFKKAPPIGFVGKDRDWLGLNLAWGGSKKIKSVFKAVAIHSKTPLTTISMDGSDHKLPNCFTRQHNMCVTEQNCSASFDKAGVPRASCLMNKSSNQSVGLLRSVN